MPLPERKTANLRHARISQAGMRYFLTICTQNRDPVLTSSVEAARISDAFAILQSAGDMDLHAATIMSDHLHLLFTLGSGLTPGQTMAKLKSSLAISGGCRGAGSTMGFEHRLRPRNLPRITVSIFHESVSGPLLSTNETWPWWRCPQPSRFRFHGAFFFR